MTTNHSIPLTLLIIDDSTPYVESLYRDAQRSNIHLLHGRSLEEGKELFAGSDGGRIAGIILDVKCLKERGKARPNPFAPFPNGHLENDRVSDRRVGACPSPPLAGFRVTPVRLVARLAALGHRRPPGGRAQGPALRTTPPPAQSRLFR